MLLQTVEPIFTIDYNLIFCKSLLSMDMYEFQCVLMRTVIFNVQPVDMCIRYLSQYIMLKRTVHLSFPNQTAFVKLETYLINQLILL